jgi:hypothetical protein
LPLLALLKVRREPMQILVVRQDRVRFSAPEVRVPDAEQRHHYRKVALERGRAEMLVDVVRALEKLLEAVHPDRERDRQPDRRPQGITPAHPVPEFEHVGGVDAEARHLLGVRRQSNEVPGDGGAVAERV